MPRNLLRTMTPSVLCGALVLGAVSVSSCRSSSRKAKPAPSAAAPTNSAAAQRLQNGTQRTYRAQLTSKASSGGSVLTQFSLRTDLTVTVVQQGPKGTTLHLQPKRVRLDTELEPLADDFAKLAPEIERPYVAELAADGSLAAYVFNDDPSSITAGIRQSLASVLQATATRRSAGPSVEYDATGRYEIEYRPTGNAGEYTRRKTRYLTFNSGVKLQRTATERDRMVPRVTQSEGTITFDAHGLVKTLNITERQQAGSGQMLPIESSTSIVLSAPKDGRAKPGDISSLLAAFAGAERYDRERPWLPKADSPQIDEARIAGRSLEQVLAELASLEAVSAKKQTSEEEKEAIDGRRAKLFAALGALIRRRPDTVAKLVGHIEGKHALASLMVDALGSSDWPEGHRALVRLVNEREMDSALTKGAAIALSRTQKPSQASIDGLKAMLGDPVLRTQAMYGLGTTIRHLRERGDEDQAQKLLSLILKELARGRDPAARVCALRAIANSGHEGAFDSVKPFLAAESRDVRAAAMEALQLIHTDEADRVLAAAMTSDEKPKVRLAATRAARLHEPSRVLVEAADKTAREDQSAHVRLGAIRALAGWLPKEPAVRSVLTQIAEHDSVEQVATAARDALEGKSQAF